MSVVDAIEAHSGFQLATACGSRLNRCGVGTKSEGEATPSVSLTSLARNHAGSREMGLSRWQAPGNGDRLKCGSVTQEMQRNRVF